MCAHQELVLSAWLARRCIRHAALAQRQVNALGRHFTVLREREQLLENLLGIGRCSHATGNMEMIATMADVHSEGLLDLVQVLIERAAQVREPAVVRGFELEIARSDL